MGLKRVLAGLFAALLTVTEALAAGTAQPWPILGRWLIASAQPAPWSVPGDPATAPFDAHLVGKSIVYARTRITGPRLLACSRANYEWQQVPPEGLFQGGLTAPSPQAQALGFGTATIATLQTGCAGAIDFHFVNRSTALFALDNMIYTLRRSR
jgi:hypothetical protein